MVSSVGSTSSLQYQPQSYSETKLTDDQKTILEEILAKYDASNLTQEQTQSLFDELKASGIKPSKEVREIMDTAGFAPPEKPEGSMPPLDQTNETEDLPDYVLEFLEKLKSGQVSEADLNSLTASLEENGEISQGLIVDKKV